ncbi:Glyoxalase/Bleomycin resistance protein/Dioxygenase superfamily protein [Sphingobium faniae]|nr:Glyoxalase/Bleomycin resistance protein/Dioxygenase superfamily protein [Sphingobium faniae]
MTTLFDGFYQMGFVARDLDRATQALGESHGIHRFRRKQASAAMESAHAWIGSMMIELIAVRPGAPDIYEAYIPDDPAAVRLHHHGFRVADGAAWDAINRRVAQAGYATPMKGAVMDGQLNYLYVDTRPVTGIYNEYVYLTGAATSIYDDVPHN